MLAFPSKAKNTYEDRVYFNKVILFPKNLEYQDAINLCYGK